MPDNEMKPCPFCGEMPKLEFGNNGSYTSSDHLIRCDNKDCAVQPSMMLTVDDDDGHGRALSAWNARATAQSAGGGEIEKAAEALWLVQEGHHYIENGESRYSSWATWPDQPYQASLAQVSFSRAEYREHARAVLTDTAREDWPIDYYKNHPIAAIRFALEKIENHLNRQLFLEAWLHGHWEVLDLAYSEWHGFVSDNPDQASTAPSNVGTGEGA